MKPEVGVFYKRLSLSKTLLWKNTLSIKTSAQPALPPFLFPKASKMHFKNYIAYILRKMARKYYGISYPDGKGSLIYKAAVELFDGETTDLEVFTIEHGPYISEIVHNFMQDIPAIANTFHELVKHPELKDHGYCVEYYYNDKDVRCMSQLNK